MYKGHVEHTMNKVLFIMLFSLIGICCNRQGSEQPDGGNMRVHVINENKFVGIGKDFAEYLFGELEFEREINGTEELSVECEVNGMVFLLDFKKEGEELYIYHDVQYPVGTSL